MLGPSILGMAFPFKAYTTFLYMHVCEREGWREREREREMAMGMRVTVRALAMAILLGSLMVWVIMPTNTYKEQWRAVVRSSVKSTYIEPNQAANLLLFTFPILCVSILGCLYLHLGNKVKQNYIQSSDDGGGRNVVTSVRKRPALVKGSLGILSWTELAFFVMFVALLLWSFTAYLFAGFSKITPKSVAKAGQQLWVLQLESPALRLGLVGNICLSLLFFPVTRGSSVLPLFGLTSEGSIKYHIWLGHIALVLFSGHGVCYIIYWAASQQLTEMTKWSKTGAANVAGELCLLCGLCMWLTALPLMRRKMFELFFYTHYLYILFLVFFILHAGTPYSCIMLPGFYLFLVDRYLRFLQSRRSVRLLSARILPCQAVELNFTKIPDLKYNPNSMMFINVPSISRLQWHPFTVSSSSSLEPDRISCMVKSEGSWSMKLYQMLYSQSIGRLEVSIEGPYGPASNQYLKHERLVLVCGGSGITPFISIIRELIFMSSTLELKTPPVLLICAFRNSASLTMLDLLLPVACAPGQISSLQLQIEAYVTREQRCSSMETPKTIGPIWFKPKASDVPLSPILGPNSWLWLAGIISASFIMFLIFLASLTHYYVYPVDRNTNKIYPASSRAVFNILLICICITVTASAAFLWNKKQNAMEISQIANLEIPSPLVSPGSLCYHPDIELDCLPNQPLLQATIKVHYGERPHLKTMLGDCKGLSVGVLASGPSKLRQEVASICSSSVGENLHFESISFSW